MICHHYRCIFVHIPKCGGKSIEHIFLNALGLDWATRAPLLLRHNDCPELGPPRLAHLTAQEYVACKYITEQQYSDYFTFAIVRNPWDRMVSLYKYLAFYPHHGFYRSISFKRFVMSEFPKKLWKHHYWFVRPQSEFIFDDNGGRMVDFIGRFEALQRAVNHVCRHVGLEPTTVPHVNRSQKRWLRPTINPRRLLTYGFVMLKNKMTPSFGGVWQDYYDTETREFVAEKYQRDIELLDYEFEPLAQRGKAREVSAAL